MPLSCIAFLRKRPIWTRAASLNSSWDIRDPNFSDERPFYPMKRRTLLLVSVTVAAVIILLLLLILRLRSDLPAGAGSATIQHPRAQGITGPPKWTGETFEKANRAPDLSAMKPWEPPPGKLSKLVGGWRPFANLAFKLETGDLLDLNEVERKALAGCLDSFVNAAGDQLASDCEVARDEAGVHYVFFPAGSKQWELLRESFERQLSSAIGSAKAAYILQSSQIDFELLTGGYGAYSRLARIEVVPPRPDGIPTPPYHVRFMQGGTMLGVQNEFSPAIQNQISMDARNTSPWSAEYYFEQPPSFLGKVVEFTDAQ